MMHTCLFPTNKRAASEVNTLRAEGLSALTRFTAGRRSSTFQGVLAGVFSLLFLSACGGGEKTPGENSVANQIPTITTPPTDTTVVAGNPATFAVVADGNPVPTVHWERSGPGGWSAITGGTGKSFTFTAEAVDHGATFRAVATNSLGAATSALATLSVNAPPAIPATPATRTVSVGGSLSLTAVATANGTLSYQWRKDGAALSGATGDTLDLGNLARGDSGVYDVEVSSTLNQTKTTATGNRVTIDVVSLPTLSLDAGALNPRCGEKVTLTPRFREAVRATLGSALGGTDISASALDGVAIPTTATTGSQTYYLRAFNAAGAFVDATAVVTHQTVSVAVARPANLNLSVGQALTFVPTVAGGLNNTVVWSGAGSWNGATWRAPSTPGKVSIRATSVDEPSVSDSFEMNVVALPTASLVASASSPRAGEAVSLVPSFKDAVRATLGTRLGGSEIAASVSDGVAIPTSATTGSQTYYLRAFNTAGGHVDATVTVAHQTVSLAVARPGNLNLSVAQSLTFVPTVAGGLNNTVVWSGAGSWNGATWRAPSTPGKVSIRATSVDDPSVSDSFEMNVVALPSPGLTASPAQPRFGETTSLLPGLRDAVRATLGTSLGGSEIAASVSDGVAIPTSATTGSQTYYLRAFNAAGSHVDATATVTHQTVQIGSILPTLSTLAVGGQTTFSASVTGGLKGTVRWSASSGTLDTATGQWTAPIVPESCVITATSEDDATQTKTLTVAVVPGPATRLDVSFPTSIVLGESATATITARDAYDNTATGYTGQVTFSSSDTFALLPTAQSLTQGVGSFTVTLKSSGGQSLTVADGALSTTLSGITVQYTAPAFSIQPADLAVDPNIATDLFATATGLPAPEITWESSRDGVTWIPASGSVSNPVAGGTASTLAFTPQLSDSGLQYRATARSLDGGAFRTATSSAARLTVAHGKVYIGGYRISGAVKHAGYWRDKTWVSLPELSPTNDSMVNVVVLTATDVYAGGYCVNSESKMIPGYWKNGQWIGLDPGNGADTQVKYMSVLVDGANTTVGMVGVPGGSATTKTGNCVWINGTRYAFNGVPNSCVSFQPKGIVVNPESFGIPLATLSADGKTTAFTYLAFLDDPTDWNWMSWDMPPDTYTITSFAFYRGTTIFAGTLRSTSGRSAGFGTMSGGAWERLAPDAVGLSNQGLVRSVANHESALYALVTANNIPPQFWQNGTWVQVPQPSSILTVNGSLFANQGGYYQAGTANDIPGYWKNAAWTYVGTTGGTTPTCIAAR